MYVFVVIILLILIYFCYIKKVNEGLENPPGFTNVGKNPQPKPAVSLYDFNLPQALDIWKDIGCTEGSKKPSETNDHWKYEQWKEEVLHYKKESDKYFKEHNYYDWTGNISGKQVIKDKMGVKSFPIGIGKARKRCHDANFKATYTYPKVGDRVKKKKYPTTNKKKMMEGDYYVGTILKKAGNKVKVLWDALGSDRTSAPDKKRLVTKDLPVEISKTHSKYNKLEHDNKNFGWPEKKWVRMPERGNNGLEKINAKKVSWIRGDSNSMVDNKEIYRVEECKNDNETECDYLKCGKRKKAAIAKYPVTYVCDGDIRNTNNDKWYCKTTGTVSTYHDKKTMCKKFLQTGKPQTYCNERCGGSGTGGCIPYKNVSHQKNTTYSGKKCIAEVIGKGSEGLIRKAILPEMKTYSKSQIKSMHGFSSIDSTKVYGGNRCRIRKDGSKDGNRYINGSFNTVEIYEEDPKVKVYTNIGGKKYGLRAHTTNYSDPKIQIYGAGNNMTYGERNAIWVPEEYGVQTFTWKNGKLCTIKQGRHSISPQKCCLEWDAQKGGGSERLQGVYGNERNAKFDCRSHGDTVNFKRSKLEVEQHPVCKLEWSKKKFFSVTKFQGDKKWGYPNTSQAKWDCGGRAGGDYVTLAAQN